MSVFQAFLLGLVQGLTEFLPVSSSGHLELGRHLLGIENAENLTFTIVVHAATVLSTLAVFQRDIRQLIKGTLSFRWNEETQLVSLLLVSAIPVGIVGFFFRDQVESLFTGNLLLVGCCLLVTATLLAFAHFSRSSMTGKIGLSHSLIMGLAQMVAVLPGISRSGATIATGIILGRGRKDVARFSFLMVLIPILGAVFLDLLKSDFSNGASMSLAPLFAGFTAAFLSGWAACRLMIKLVTSGKLIYFSIYCLTIGLIAIFAG